MTPVNLEAESAALMQTNRDWAQVAGSALWHIYSATMTEVLP